jgi:cation/acetate symporter
MAASKTAGAYGRIAWLFTGAFVGFVLVLALLGHFGLPGPALGTLLGAVTLFTFAAIGVSGSTMQTSEFYLAGRALPAAANGVAGAAALISGAMFLGLAGIFFADSERAAVFIIGVSLGFLVLAVAIAPYFRKSGAFGVADFLGVRYGGRAVRLVAVVVVVAALFAALAAAIATAAMLAATLLAVSMRTAFALVIIVAVLTCMLGGARAISRAAVVQYIVMVVAFLAPVMIVSLREFSVPVPQLTFGFALKDAGLLALASGRDLAAALPSRLLPFSASGTFDTFTAIVCLAAGVACLPHVLLRSATAATVEGARRSAAWSLLFVLVIALAAPAYAAFARLFILREVVDSAIGTLPGWIFAYGKLGLVQTCGVDAVAVDAVAAACTGGTLPANDLALGGDAIVRAAPAIFGLPPVFTALVAAGGLAAALAAANAIAFALASALGHDLYGSVIDRHASAGRRLIVTRLALAAAVVAAAWLATGHADGVEALALSAVSLSAGGLFPAIVLGVWWRRANAIGAVAAVVAGALATGLIIAENHLGGTLLPTSLDWLGLSDLTAAILGLPIGLAACVVFSLATPPPSEDRNLIVAAIRRPGGTPFVQESESL